MYKIALTLRKKEDHMTFFMNQTYYQFLSSHFHIELVIPRQNQQYQDIVQRNDALLICGGCDINPRYFHESLHPTTQLEDPLIETTDFALLQQFYHNQKPIFGICRGIQVINVFFKGNLYQDIASQYTTSLQHTHENHIVEIQPNTRLSQYFPHSIQVNSSHHQNIKEVPPLFHINAISEDGLIEGIENKHVLAVQWHPERLSTKHQKAFMQMMIDFITNNELSNT